MVGNNHAQSFLQSSEKLTLWKPILNVFYNRHVALLLKSIASHIRKTKEIGNLGITQTDELQ